MKRISIFSLTVVFIISFLAQPISSKGYRSKSGKGMVPYEDGDITTIEGKITNIKTSYNPITNEDGLHIMVTTSSKEFIVHVCPQWYADQQKFKFYKGEILTIKGSQFYKDGKPNIYAASIIRRFSSLSKTQQKKLAGEIMITTDLSSIVDKYGISLKEVQLIKKRVEASIINALFPKPLNLRVVDTGDGLWRERYSGGRQEKQNKKYRMRNKIR